jgi:hypothetical protein
MAMEALNRLNNSGNPAITFKHLLEPYSDAEVIEAFFKVVGIDVTGVPRGNLWSIIRYGNERVTVHGFILEYLMVHHVPESEDQVRMRQLIGARLKMHAWIVQGYEHDMDVIDDYYTGKVLSFDGEDMYRDRLWKVEWDQYDDDDDRYAYLTFTEVMQHKI